ncbi:MAG: hypothetical protein HYY44_08035 [Deltaproteobacteria bacterium]|nr:hypothetical protein [Deltaproteobacteria bacterium]
MGKFGVYYGSRPPMLGGNPEEARKSFEAAIQTTGGKLLMPYLLEAQFLAVQLQDKKLFEEMIAKVESAPSDQFPEQRLANELAKERVKYLREKEKQFF